MATNRPGLLFESSGDPANIDLHGLATVKKPEFSQDPGVVGVAVLDHKKDAFNCQPEDFFWFKVKAKHNVGKLRRAYQERFGAEVSFRHPAFHITDSTPMSELSHRNNIVVFTAHAILTAQAPTPAFAAQMSSINPSAAAATHRNPLQPVNSQLQSRIPNIPLNPNPFHNSYNSPYARASQSTNSANSMKSNVPDNDENSEPPCSAGSRISSDSRYSTNPRFGSESRYSTEPRVSIELRSSGGFDGSTSFVKQASVAGSAGQTIPPPYMGHLVPASTSATSTTCFVKVERGDDDREPTDDHGAEVSSSTAGPITKSSLNSYIQNLIEQGSPTLLEKDAKRCQAFLDRLKQPFDNTAERHADAYHWLSQIEALQKSQVNTPTIIGVVGNTGAGKSSVINAILDEERLVPTNCFRACTSVVTEISWNTSNKEEEKYRVEIEFIQAVDWEKDLRMSLEELIDSSGNVSRECTNAESEAGVAYAKIKAVYPTKSKDQLAHSTIEQLMNERSVKEVLGTVKKFAKAEPEVFYRELQKYVDSKEKATGEKKKKDKAEKVQMEFWPLIKVVRIYVKADALSTGAVMVDLPGVHDSNAARAAVAAGYMKQCTGLWIVAPINRAVDDKAAKSLLGESFKRQLKYDGTYSRVTFICSKTDDISITEASDSLGLMDEMASDWDKIDNIEKQKREIKNLLKDIKESRSVYGEIMSDADDAIELWEKLKEDLEDGKEVRAPSENSKKRKLPATTTTSRKKAKRSKDHDSDDEDDFIHDDEQSCESEADTGEESSSEEGRLLEIADTEEKLAQLKADKKQARQHRLELDTKVKSLNQELKSLEKTQKDIETTMSSICIAGRNKYSKGAIQQDFAAGVRELDQEAAVEEDEANFDPELEIRDYQEVAQSLPVFCVSSRAYQKLSGRMQRDADVPGFQTIEETEIPLLQAHCKMLTEAGRAANCRQFFTRLSQLINSLSIWAANDGTGLNLSDAQMAVETRTLKLKLKNLEKDLEDAVKSCLQEMNQALAENIFENCDHIMQVAIAEANNTVARWHAPVNRDSRADGGFYYSTYKALTRRAGVFTNAQGPHDLNQQLTDPIIKHLANHWERVFARRLPSILQNFTRKSRLLLKTFHHEVEGRSLNAGAGVARLAMLGQQLKNYEAIFETLSTQMIEVINGLQRGANREFTPVIGRHLASAYEYCANESGPGCFKRMKEQMSTHVDTHRSIMFKESCDEVKGRLVDMCRHVEEYMANKADEVFMNMQRDYLEVVSGSRLPQGQVMPRWERQMRAAVSRAIEEFVDKKVNGTDAPDSPSGGSTALESMPDDAQVPSTRGIPTFEAVADDMVNRGHEMSGPALPSTAATYDPFADNA